MDNAAMTQLLGISFSSVWWAFGYLMAFCLISAPLDRLLGKLSGSGKIVHFVLDAVANSAVLFLLDRLIGGISVSWWAVLVLALAAVALTVFSDSGK